MRAGSREDARQVAVEASQQGESAGQHQVQRGRTAEGAVVLTPDVLRALTMAAQLMA